MLRIADAGRRGDRHFSVTLRSVELFQVGKGLQAAGGLLVGFQVGQTDEISRHAIDIRNQRPSE